MNTFLRTIKSEEPMCTLQLRRRVNGSYDLTLQDAKANFYTLLKSNGHQQIQMAIVKGAHWAQVELNLSQQRRQENFSPMVKTTLPLPSGGTQTTWSQSLKSKPSVSGTTTIYEPGHYTWTNHLANGSVISGSGAGRTSTTVMRGKTENSLISKETRQNPDGSTTVIKVETDDRGNTTRTERTENPDGSGQVRVIETNSQGQVVREASGSKTISSDANGNRVETKHQEVKETDPSSGTTSSYESTRTENTVTGETSEVTTETHTEPSGETVSTTTSSYSDGEGNSSTTTVSTDGLGNTVITTDSTDSEGNEYVHTTEINSNGQITSDESEEYPAQNEEPDDQGDD